MFKKSIYDIYYESIYYMLSEVFYTILLTTCAGLVIKICSMAYKSKCKEVVCCCLKIIRDTDAEEKEEEFRLTHPPKTPEATSNKESPSI
jgi:hypothetical protein